MSTSTEAATMARILVYTPPTTGIATGTGAGGYAGVPTSAEWLASLTAEERRELAARSKALVEPERVDLALDSLRGKYAVDEHGQRRPYTTQSSWEAWEVTAPTLEAVHEALRTKIGRDQAQAEQAATAAAQRIAEATAELEAWLAGPQAERRPWVYDGTWKELPADLRERVTAASKAQEARAKEVERQERRASLRTWVDTLAAEDRALPEVAAALDAQDPGVRFGGGARDAAHRAVEAAHEARIEAGRRAWVARCGSEHLRSLVELGIDYGEAYELERVKLELPGWALYSRIPGLLRDQGREPKSPPPEAVTLLRRARQAIPDAQLLEIDIELEDDDGWRGFVVRGEVDWCGESLWLGVPSKYIERT